MYISCNLIYKLRPAAPRVCCGSCHIDNEDFGYDLCSVDGPDGQVCDGGVCCRMSTYLGDNPLTEEEWRILESLAL